MLDKKTFPLHDLLAGHDRDEILASCRALSSRVEWFGDYVKDDFTVFMYRNDVDAQITV